VGRTADPRPWVFFDVDQTLCDFEIMMGRALQATADLINRRYPRLARGALSPADLQTARQRIAAQSPPGVALMELRRQSFAWALAGTTDDPTEISAITDFYRVARYRDPVIFDDVRPTLAALEPRARLGTISNGNSTLALLGLHDHFECEFAAEAIGFAKPDRRIYAHVAAQIAAEPASLMMVGDSYHADVAGAEAAGWRAVWLQRDRPSRPPARIQTLLDLVDLF
jgi:HAD superfamily hydrolase (TIGR01509 family)